MACFRDLSPITNRQKPSHPQPSTIPPRAFPATHPAQKIALDILKQVF